MNKLLILSVSMIFQEDFPCLKWIIERNNLSFYVKTFIEHEH